MKATLVVLAALALTTVLVTADAPWSPAGDASAAPEPCPMGKIGYGPVCIQRCTPDTHGNWRCH